MKFDFRLNGAVVALFSLLSLTVVLAITQSAILLTWNVHVVEAFQAILLFICVPFTWFYVRPDTLTEQKKWF